MEIVISALRKEYGDLVAVQDVSFGLPRGAILALVGPNGAGKTSLMKMMAGLLKPTAGTLRIGEIDGASEPKRLHQVIGFLPDFFGLYEDLTVTEYLRYFARAYRLSTEVREDRIRATIQAVGLEAKRDDFLENLSRGMRQRVGVARCLIHDPPVILLDEPAAGLDPEARALLQDLFVKLAKDGKTLIISSHILTELEEYCTHVAMMGQGSLKAFGPIHEVRKSHRLPERKIILETLKTATPAQEALSRHGQIGAIEVLGGERLRLTFSGDDSELAALLKGLIQADVPVISFYEDLSSIQDTYLKVMKGTSS